MSENVAKKNKIKKTKKMKKKKKNDLKFGSKSFNPIDEIFKKAKILNAKRRDVEKKKKIEQEKMEKINTKENEKVDNFLLKGRELKKGKRKMTEDGLPIFSPDELNIGKGGDTELCPFDCKCCY